VQTVVIDRSCGSEDNAPTARARDGSRAEHAAEAPARGQPPAALDSGLRDPARGLQAGAGAVVGRLSVVLGDSEAPARLLEAISATWRGPAGAGSRRGSER
jgi:hypothetical protein